MLPFTIQFTSGIPVYEQVVFAVKKAVMAGRLLPGENFPSVRQLSQELRINPNTAQKIISALTAEGILEVYPGRGTVIASGPATNGEQKKKFLDQEVEKLVVEAGHCQITLAELLRAVERQWTRLKR